MSASNRVEREEKDTTVRPFSCALIRFGPYEVDRRAGRIRKHNLRLRLSGQPLEVLILLLEHPGEVVTREELRQRLWPTDIYVDFERSLNSAVKKLRRALNDNPQDPRYIETLPRKGYRFIGTIEPPQVQSSAESDSTEASLLPTPSHAPLAAGQELISLPAPESKKQLGKWVALAGGAALLVLSAILFFRAHRKPATVPLAVPVRNAEFRSTIAVLGFKNLSSGHDADWLSTAITEMLATELGSGEKIRIIPGETVARAKVDLGLKEKEGYPRDTLRALRADLGSDYVVAGSYVALGDKHSGQVRLDLRLQESISGETLASVAVSGNQSEIFDLVGRAGREMRAKLGATVPPAGDVDWRTVLPGNPEAARLYSQGLAHLRVFENLAASEALLKCVTLEPNFALGHAALAQAWSALGYDVRAVSSAQKAQSLSNSLPEDERLKVEGRYYELQHDWAGAIAAYRHLWQDFPDDLESGLRLAAAQTAAGNFNDALATLSSLRSAPPQQRDDPRIDLAEAAIAARNADYKRQQALAENATSKAQSTGARLLLARAQLVKGWALDDQSQLQEAKEAYTSARQIFEQAGDRDGTATALNNLGIVLQKQGDLSGARQYLEQARDVFREVGDKNGYGSALTNLGEVYRAQGDLAQAGDLYRQAISIFRASGRKDNEYAAMNNLGSVLYQLGDFRGARKLYEDLLELRKAADDRNGVAFARANLAEALRIQGELHQALALYPLALATFREIGDRSTTTAVQRAFAQALIAAEDFAAARRILQEALSTDLELGASGDAAMDRIRLAEVALEEGRPAEVGPAVRENLNRLQQEQRTDDEIEAGVLLTRAFLAEGNTDAAAATIKPVAALAAKRSDRLVRFHVALAVAQVHAAQGQSSQANLRLAAALKDARQMGCFSCQLEVRLALGEARIKNRQTEAGRLQLRAVAREAQERGFALIASRAARAAT